MIKTIQSTTYNRFNTFRIEAVALYTHPPDLSGGIFNIIANKCKLTPLFDTSSSCHRAEERGIQGGYFTTQTSLLRTQHSKILFHEPTTARQSKCISFALA